MPTENRSSNTEMVSVPRQQLQAWQERFSKAQMFQQSTEIKAALAQQSPQPQAEPVALQRKPWNGLLATADNLRGEGWNACLDEIAKLGPLYTRPVQGEPVAWMDPRSPQMHATISNQVKQHNLRVGGAPGSAINGYTIPLYTHADPNLRWKAVADEQMRVIEHLKEEVERLRTELEEWKKRCQYNADTAHDVGRERDTLRAQLAERDALLRDIASGYWELAIELPADLLARLQVLSASAGPSSPTWSCQACQVEQPTDRACDACGGQTELIGAKS